MGSVINWMLHTFTVSAPFIPISAHVLILPFLLTDKHNASQDSQLMTLNVPYIFVLLLKSRWIMWVSVRSSVYGIATLESYQCEESLVWFFFKLYSPHCTCASTYYYMLISRLFFFFSSTCKQNLQTHIFNPAQIFHIQRLSQRLKHLTIPDPFCCLSSEFPCWVSSCRGRYRLNKGACTLRGKKNVRTSVKEMFVWMAGLMVSWKDIAQSSRYLSCVPSPGHLHDRGMWSTSLLSRRNTFSTIALQSSSDADVTIGKDVQL